jgi:CRISPR-associated protein Cmr4
MYNKAYGIIQTLAPLHVGASAGEETGNLNLIFRDQFTKTGIIPGSSIRGRFRAYMRTNIKDNVSTWYGHEAVKNEEDKTTEAYVKFEYASLIWFPVFCPGQPIVWVTCPYLLKRYNQITKIKADIADIPKEYTAGKGITGRPLQAVNRKVLFFNLGFLEIEREEDLSAWIPEGVDIPQKNLVVVSDNDISMLHDMGLYRQSRVQLRDNEKKVADGAFFNVEALPEGCVFIFPIALKEKGWKPFEKDPNTKENQENDETKTIITTETSEKTETTQENQENKKTEELYFGGLESVGFGRCNVTLFGDY